jgi:uncharacterized protein (DUF2147 family)
VLHLASVLIFRQPAKAVLPVLFLAVLFAVSQPVAAQDAGASSPAGLWQTISDVDGKPAAYIRIRETNGEFSGTIEDIIDPVKRGKTCEKCNGPRHDQPVLGMTVLTGIHRDGDHFGGGEIVDPDNGNVYSCKLTLIDGGKRLNVRGFLGFSLFGRTQTWVRQP